jgi:hypothetical protein
MAQLASGRILVAWAAEEIPPDPTTPVSVSTVRFTLIDEAAGTRIFPCSSGDRELELTSPGVFSTAPTVARADFDRTFGQTVALIGWGEWPNGDTTQPPRIRAQYLDAGGCPLGQPFKLVSDLDIPNAQGLTLAWSEPGQFVVAAFHDGERIYVGKIADNGFADVAQVASLFSVGGAVAVAVGSDGGILAVWNGFETAQAMVQGTVGTFAALLDDNAHPRHYSATPQGATLSLDFPENHKNPGSFPTVVVRPAAIGYTIATDLFFPFESKNAATNTIHSYAIDLDSTGAQIRPHYELAAGQEGNGRASVVPLDETSSIAVWLSRGQQGTVGELLTSERSVRFNAVACGERPFDVGTRTSLYYGWPQPLVVRDHIWVFHTTQPKDDSRGSGVAAWRVSWDALYPTR